MVVDDYGHHPTEIRATLAAAKQGWNRRMVMLFQPHRYTRTRDLIEEFSGAFDQADVLFVTDIYAAGEAEISGVTGKNWRTLIGRPDILPFLGGTKGRVGRTRARRMLMSGDMVITLGSRRYLEGGPELLERL